MKDIVRQPRINLLIKVYFRKILQVHTPVIATVIDTQYKSNLNVFLSHCSVSEHIFLIKIQSLHKKISFTNFISVLK